MASTPAIAAECVAPPAGLVSWWRAEGNALDGGGTNNGILRGGATFAPGKVGQGFSLNGSDAYVEVPHSATLSLSNEVTVEFWYKDMGSATTYGLVAKRGAYPDPCNYGINVAPGVGNTVQVYYNDPAVFFGGAGYEVLNYQPAPTPGVFHHFATSFRQAGLSQIEVKLYLDGQGVRTETLPGTLASAMNAAPLTIGASAPMANGELFKGVIDEISIYRRALSAAEVQAIFNADTAGKCGQGSPPQIAVQPQSQTAPVGATVTMSVGATGTAPLSYQWWFQTSPVSGATSSDLSLSNVQLAMAGDYQVVVANGFGSVTSAVATLTVSNPPPVCVSPPSGLVSWWQAEGDGQDAVGPNNAILRGGASFAPGKVGQGFILNGSDAYIEVPHNATLNLTNELTMEFWYKDTGSTATYGLVAKRGVSTCNYAINVVPGGTMQVYFNDPVVNVGNGGFELTPYQPVPSAGVFHHLAVTMRQADSDHVEMKLYVDGQPVKTASLPGNLARAVTATPLTIGTSVPSVSGELLRGVIDEVSLYNRALPASEVLAVYQSGSGGKCDVAIAPSIVTQPSDSTAVTGGSATFTVGAAGTKPLAFQWARNGVSLAGATASSLTLTNVQLSQAGSYAVTVTNSVGSVTSSNAVLSVTFPPATVRVEATSGMAGGPVTVPVEIVANGNENGLQFSLNFNPALLTYAGVELDPGLGDATLFVNTSQTAAGRLGCILSLPTGTPITAGTQQVLHVTFSTAIRTTGITTPLSFGDAPTVRQLVNVQAGTLSATYTGANVSLSPSVLEADVNPRPVGDTAVTVADWVLLGRYAARLDYPTNASEFQRADCAPRSTAGDGAIRVTDWVQAGRYAGAADPLAVVGGPMAEAPTLPRSGRGPKDADRRVLVSNGSWFGGQTGVVTVVLEAQGSESALGFSLAFDPSRFVYVGAVKGTSSTSATLNVNATQAAAGKVGLALALSSGSFPAGGRELVKVTLRALPAAPAGPAAVSFADLPVPREISDPLAQALAADYLPGTITIQPPPMLKIMRSGSSVTLTWPLAASNFTVKASAALNGANWISAPGTPAVVNGEYSLVLPATDTTLFYRLMAP